MAPLPLVAMEVRVWMGWGDEVVVERARRLPCGIGKQAERQLLVAPPLLSGDASRGNCAPLVKSETPSPNSGELLIEESLLQI